MMSHQGHFGEQFVHASVITREQLEQAVYIQQEEHEFLGKILLELGWLSGSQLCRIVSQAIQQNERRL